MVFSSMVQVMVRFRITISPYSVILLLASPLTLVPVTLIFPATWFILMVIMVMVSLFQLPVITIMRPLTPFTPTTRGAQASSSM